MIRKMKKNRNKMVVGLMCMALALFGLAYEAAAVDKEELQVEIEKIAVENPELAREMQHELESAIREGEIEVESEGRAGDAADIDWETPEGRAQAVTEIDSHKEDLVKQGLTESDIDKLKELVASGDKDPEKFKEIFEKDGHPIFEGGREGEFFKEGMEGEYGREMMERMMQEVAGREEGDRMREFGMEREMTVKEQADKETFERAMREGDRETMERLMREYEGQEHGEHGDREAMEREMREHGEFDREAMEREMMERGEREFGEREAFEREYAEREFERPSPGEYREPPPGFEPPPEP